MADERMNTPMNEVSTVSVNKAGWNSLLDSLKDTVLSLSSFQNHL